MWTLARSSNQMRPTRNVPFDSGSIADTRVSQSRLCEKGAMDEIRSRWDGLTVRNLANARNAQSLARINGSGSAIA